jgi:hypothetical protein
VRAEAIQPALPRQAIVLDPVRRVLELRWPQPAFPRPTDLGGDDEVDCLEDADVFLDAVERQVERASELADRRRAAGESFQDASPRGVGQGEERAVKGCALCTDECTLPL